MVTLALKSDPVQVGVAFPAAILACIITGGLWVSEINSLDNNNNNPRIINSKRALNFSCYL